MKKRPLLISPSILAADFARLGEEVRAIDAALAEARGDLRQGRYVSPRVEEHDDVHGRQREQHAGRGQPVIPHSNHAELFTPSRRASRARLARSTCKARAAAAQLPAWRESAVSIACR